MRVNKMGLTTRSMKRHLPREVPQESVVEENLAPGLELNSGASNYIRWIADLVSPYVRGRVLEIGAGRGDFTEIFQLHGQIVATELSSDSIEYLSDRFRSNSKVDVRAFDIFSNSDERFDTVVLINVLEHIRNDEEALRSIHGLLRPGGRIVVYVPAFWTLYSRFDNSIGHYRRYRLKELRCIGEESGFTSVDGRYVNAVGAIGWFIVCRLLRRDASESVSVGLMDRVVIPIMRKFERVIRVPFGISVLYIGKKPETETDEQ